MPYNIAFDTAHKPRGRIDENLTELRDHLNANDFVCYNFLEVPITEESLTPYDILVFVCPDFAKISSLEITEILKWIKNSGGGLLLLSHAGGDRGRNSNLSEISEQCGIAFENDQVLDSTINLGIENIPKITTFNIPHPITNGIDSLCYRSGCSLTIIGGGAFSIADSNETSEPFSCPLICVSELEKGRICCIGSYEMFRDKVGGGFQCDHHSALTLNIFKWLISDYRMELRSAGQVPAPTPEVSVRSTQVAEQPDLTANSTSTTKRAIDIDFSMKISRKSELMELLKIFQNQINTIKNTIDKLIKTTEASEKEIIELNETYIPRNPPQPQEILPDTRISEDTEKKGSVKSGEQEEPTLTALPPKPGKLEEEEDFIGLPLVDDESKISLKPAPKLKSISKSKSIKELKKEKKGLETKVDSVKNLMQIIDKKRDSGKINDDSYVKQSKRLQSDLKKAKKRISSIDKLLKKK
jgi:hypothetical protein